MNVASRWSLLFRKLCNFSDYDNGGDNDDDDDSIQFNSILHYLCAESTALRPITDTAQCTCK
jgi:hypothetical protein